MAADTHTIEVNADTADRLAQLAAERGLTVSELVAELAIGEASEADIAELDRRWQRVQSGEDKTIPHEKVVEWLRTWGTHEFRPRIEK